jgi:processive 1,2-diacylglycerol beta-glucosyltransferase
MKKNRKPRLLLLYASAGAGHKQAARALKKACNETSLAVAEDIDILDYTPKYFKRFYTGSYLEIVKRMPELWGYLYGRSYKVKKPTLSTRLHHVIGNIHTGRLSSYVKKFKPDALIFTHFLGWGALGSLKRLKVLDVPFYCVVTDFAVHSFWINNHINRYYVATEGIKRVLKHHGFKDSQIRITGIPADPIFSRPVNKSKVCKSIRLDPKKPIVLMISGRYNLTGYEHLLQSFKDVKEKIQIIVLAGRDKMLFGRMEKIAKGLRQPTRIYGMVDNMHELMAVSDIVISKPGGLTTSEVLASKTLMAIIDPIPGQELRNSDYMLESGVALRIHDMENGGLKIADLLKNKRRFGIMRRHLQYVSHPDAAYEIVRDIVKDLR